MLMLLLRTISVAADSRDRLPQSRVNRAVAIATLMGGIALNSMAAPLPSLWPGSVQKLDLTVIKPPYVVVARPVFGQRFNGVDVVGLDPVTLRPTSRSATGLNCLRVHTSANGNVMCFTNVVPNKVGQFSNPTNYVYAPDLSLASTHVNQSTGRPNRARMSADGKFSATTEFATGHSYIGVGGDTFSTLTLLVRNGAPGQGENIQDWSVLHEGREVNSVDLNLWGVSFDPSNSNRFYVTAYFAGRPYLAEGSVSDRRIVVVKEGVECPSFSPDGKRLAFKKRTSATGWSPAVLELPSLKEKIINVSDSVDDQIEWLDNHTLVYEIVTRPLIGSPTSDLMSLNIDSPHPQQQVWLEQARSPGFVRGRRD